jgi:hypothetical protein
LKTTRVNKQSLLSALRKTRALLDEKKNWSLVLELGNALFNENPTSVRRVRWDYNRFEQFVKEA